MSDNTKVFIQIPMITQNKINKTKQEIVDSLHLPVNVPWKKIKSIKHLSGRRSGKTYFTRTYDYKYMNLKLYKCIITSKTK